MPLCSFPHPLWGAATETITIRNKAVKTLVQEATNVNNFHVLSTKAEELVSD